MKPELEKALIDKYPCLFGKWSTGQFQCGDGWYDLIDTACSLILNHERVIAEDAARYRDKSGVYYESGFMMPNGCQTLVFQYRAFAVQQIKESQGSLCIWHTGGDRFTFGAVRMAELMSLRVCKLCGNKKSENLTKRGWDGVCAWCNVVIGLEQSKAGLTTVLDLSTLAEDDQQELPDLNGLEQLMETMSAEEKRLFLQRIGIIDENGNPKE